MNFGISLPPTTFHTSHTGFPSERGFSDDFPLTGVFIQGYPDRGWLFESPSYIRNPLTKCFGVATVNDLADAHREDLLYFVSINYNQYAASFIRLPEMRQEIERMTDQELLLRSKKLFEMYGANKDNEIRPTNVNIAKSIFDRFGTIFNAEFDGDDYPRVSPFSVASNVTGKRKTMEPTTPLPAETPVSQMFGEKIEEGVFSDEVEEIDDSDEQTSSRPTKILLSRQPERKKHHLVSYDGKRYVIIHGLDGTTWTWTFQNHRHVIVNGKYYDWVERSTRRRGFYRVNNKR